MINIFLDLDNVVVNFVKGAAKLFNEDYEELLKRWPLGLHDMEKVLGISRDKLFATLDAAGEDYWADLPPYPYTKDLYDYCLTLAPTYILSSPTMDPGCLSGKLRWLYKTFGKGFRNYVFTPHKEMCARGTHILIDDYASNIAKFKENGGQAIMWPTPFNARHAESDNAYEIVKAELASLFEKKHGQTN